MPLTMWGANHHLDLVYGGGTPATLYLAVMYTPPEYRATGSDLDEPVGSGYARASVTNDVASWADAADGMKSNAVHILFPTATGDWGTLRHWALCSAATGGEIVSWGTVPARLVLNGSTLRFLKDQLRITMR